MNKISALGLLTLALFLSLSPSRLLFAYDDTLVMESLQTIQGDITEVDSDQKRMTVRWMADDILLKYQDITLSVPNTCVITKNSETIELDDLESGDPATVRFDANAQPLGKAISITVSE